MREDEASGGGSAMADADARETPAAQGKRTRDTAELTCGNSDDDAAAHAGRDCAHPRQRPRRQPGPLQVNAQSSQRDEPTGGGRREATTTHEGGPAENEHTEQINGLLQTHAGNGEGASAGQGSAESGLPAVTGPAVSRPKRRNDAPDSYDETVRRAPRSNDGRAAYVDDHSRKRKRVAIEVGPVAIERMVRGRYEWRDASLPPVRGPRARWWQRHG